MSTRSQVVDDGRERMRIMEDDLCGFSVRWVRAQDMELIVLKETEGSVPI